MGESERVVRQSSFIDTVPQLVRKRPGRQGQSKYANLYDQMAQIAEGSAVCLKMLFESKAMAGKVQSAVGRYEQWAGHNDKPHKPSDRKWVTGTEPLAHNDLEGACWLYLWLEKIPGPVQIPKGVVD